MPTSPTDANIRDQALNPAQSFVVQAPAGSGKTAILIQRYLALLETVEHPENILAITFTRKAAAEMRERLIRALILAAQATPPESAYDRVLWQLGQRVLERDRSQGWQLLENPNRLRIQTIDSFCAYLTHQLPLTSGGIASGTILDDPSAVFSETVSQFILENLASDHLGPALRTLLLHLDNQLPKIAERLSDLLSKRDQWGFFLAALSRSENPRAQLESYLQAYADACLARLTQLLPQEIRTQIHDCICVAQPDYLGTALPSGNYEQLAYWQTLADLLLTKDGDWRKTWNKNQGFFAPSDAKNAAEKATLTAQKSAMQTLSDTCQTITGLQLALIKIIDLPTPQYTDTQWDLIEALLTLLPYLLAYLMLTFHRQQTIDYTGVALCALEALGDSDAPTDLALALDYHLQHILVDEFQDTSVLQWQLLETLTAGWQADDGHSLFLVGDPMQSIYRFRKAEVGLFLRAMQDGIGQVSLTPLQLSANFRSQTSLVQSYNRIFQNIFPAQHDLSQSVIAFYPAEPILPVVSADPIQCYLTEDAATEADTIVSIIQATPADHSIAILVRQRSDLRAVLPALKHAGIRFTAVEIDSLAEKICVRDLFTLTRALLRPADRLAWLAILRAPWCGCSLDTLHRIATVDVHSSIWENWCTLDWVTRSEVLTPELERFDTVMHIALGERDRVPLARWVEGVWVALGGPAFAQDATDMLACQRYFALLADAATKGSFSIEDFGQTLKRATLSTAPDEHARVDIMTIHKSKGLEFDTVILAGLQRPPRDPDRQLLLWEEHLSAEGEMALLLAPIHAESEKMDPLYKMVKQEIAHKDHLESQRLLYVGLTRAKQQLHLLSAEIPNKETPKKNSLLSFLWPSLSEQFLSNILKGTAAENEIVEPTLTCFAPDNVFPTEWEMCNAVPASHNPKITIALSAEQIFAQQLGVVMHRVLAIIGRSDTPMTTLQTYIDNPDPIRLFFRSEGGSCVDIETGTAEIQTALKTMQVAPDTPWLFSPKHIDNHCEWSLMIRNGKRTENRIIDRSFIDVETGIRWIIDYKTMIPRADESLAEFDARARAEHRDQLLGYQSAVAAYDPTHPIKLALYFPMVGRLLAVKGFVA